ncbi:MAG: putative metalloprotease [Motiliproteus sp.]|jgi:putative metalloprotease
MRNNRLLPLALVALLTGCASDGSFDTGSALALGATVFQATTLDADSVRETATLAARQLDSQSKLAAANSAYSQRLQGIVRGLERLDGLNFNYRVYLAEDINAFAMADGTVRVHSALLDAMPDDQALAVIAHEIGHVKLKHSYRQMRETLLTNALFQGAVAVGGTIGSLTSSQLGSLAHSAVTARFSQADELEADEFAVQLLQRQGKDPQAMKRSIETLRDKYGNGGGFLSSHPSNDQRIARIEEAISRLR